MKYRVERDGGASNDVLGGYPWLLVDSSNVYRARFNSEEMARLFCAQLNGELGVTSSQEGERLKRQLEEERARFTQNAGDMVNALWRIKKIVLQLGDVIGHLDALDAIYRIEKIAAWALSGDDEFLDPLDRVAPLSSGPPVPAAIRPKA